jgi:hypothetical protein
MLEEQGGQLAGPGVQGVIKRIALVLALVGAVSVAGMAWAVTYGFNGTFDGQRRATLSFDLVQNEKTNERKVKHWEWDDLRIRCRNGKHRYDGKFKRLAIPVEAKTREFTFTAVNDWGGKAVLFGTFDPDYTIASGTFRIKGRTSVGKHCRSGEVGWTASRPTS